MLITEVQTDVETTDAETVTDGERSYDIDTARESTDCGRVSDTSDFTDEGSEYSDDQSDFTDDEALGNSGGSDPPSIEPEHSHPQVASTPPDYARAARIIGDDGDSWPQFPDDREDLEEDLAARLAAAKAIKEIGNKAYKEKEYYVAMEKYNKAINYLEIPVLWVVEQRRPNRDEQTEIDQLREQCLSNLAAAKLFLRQYDGVIDDCTTVLESDPRNLKAYFRRAKARQQLDDIPGAVKDLRWAAVLDCGRDSEITRLLRSVLKENKRYLKGLGLYKDPDAPPKAKKPSSAGPPAQARNSDAEAGTGKESTDRGQVAGEGDDSSDSSDDDEEEVAAPADDGVQVIRVGALPGQGTSEEDLEKHRETELDKFAKKRELIEKSQELFKEDRRQQKKQEKARRVEAIEQEVSTLENRVEDMKSEIERDGSVSAKTSEAITQLENRVKAQPGKDEHQESEAGTSLSSDVGTSAPSHEDDPDVTGIAGADQDRRADDDRTTPSTSVEEDQDSEAYMEKFINPPAPVIKYQGPAIDLEPDAMGDPDLDAQVEELRKKFPNIAEQVASNAAHAKLVARKSYNNVVWTPRDSASCEVNRHVV